MFLEWPTRWNGCANQLPQATTNFKVDSQLSLLLKTPSTNDNTAQLQRYIIQSRLLMNVNYGTETQANKQPTRLVQSR